MEPCRDGGYVALAALGGREALGDVECRRPGGRT